MSPPLSPRFFLTCATVTVLAFSSGMPAAESKLHTTSLREQASAAKAAHDLDKAIEILTAAIASDPDSGDAYIDRGLCYWASKRTDFAVRDFKRAVEVAPTLARAYIYRGDLAFRYVEKNFAAAEADYATAFGLNPDYEGFYAYTAELYLYSGKPALALADAKKGANREPTSLIHQVNLAHGLLFTGHLDQAKEVYLAIADKEIGHGRKGAAFALGDFELIDKNAAVKYPQIAEITPWLRSLVRPE